MNLRLRTQIQYWLTLIMVFSIPVGMANGQPVKVAEVEGITEYRLENGLQLLLYPDPSSPKVTVSMTAFVGSRHEGAGEGGMAHLLEHMLFKGTPSHQDIPKLLQQRGAQFNGTTNSDRTNYFETLPASDENLEFAIRLEADRMVNSNIRGEDLASEMTVVRNEFERSENSPQSVLRQKMMSVAYQWHNYGRATIGNRSDIERVPITKLREFYRKYYQPDNVMVVVAGKFDHERALELVQKYFGSIPKPTRKLPKTYTIEPPQDGERSVTLRRVGQVGVVGALYHVPSASHEDFASVSVLAGLLSDPPAGRLYKALVETKLASDAGGGALPQHDPSVMLFLAEVPKLDNLNLVRDRMLEVVEGVALQPVTSDEVDRARQRLLKRRELSLSNTSMIAVSLSSWAAQGDWRLFFLNRDRLEAVTPESVQRVAEAYLVKSNRTVGTYMPSQETERTSIPDVPDLTELVKNYRGREQTQEGEQFDPSPAAIEARTERWNIKDGPRVALLPKKTRGQAVQLELTLRYGTAKSLKGRRAATSLLPTLMLRGTRKLSRQELQDALDKNLTTLRGFGGLGEATFTLQTKRDNLPTALDLMRQVLREPSLPESELELLRESRVSSLGQYQSDPQALSDIMLEQLLQPFPKSDVRYVPSIEERMDAYRDVKHQDIVELYEQFLGAEHAQLAIVGDFDPKQIKPILTNALGGWQVPEAFKRIVREAQLKVAGGRHQIRTPDKENAVYNAGRKLAIKNTDKDYPALLLGNWVLGFERPFVAVGRPGPAAGRIVVFGSIAPECFVAGRSRAIRRLRHFQS